MTTCGDVTMRLEVGDLIAGRYRVVEHIGQGGTSDVLRVTDTALNDDRVALKLVLPQPHSDMDLEERLRREVLLARRLGHPNIVRVYDFGTTPNGVVFITMEYVEGKNLRHYLEVRPQRQLAVGEVLTVVSEVATALDYAHRNDVVHRDLKPENIFISANSRVKLGDFGSARNISSQKGITKPGYVVGTAGYMAPEQLAGKRVDARTDIFALGILSYEMLAGDLPHPAETDIETALMHVEFGLPKLDGLPWWMQEFVETCAELDRNDRYQSMTDVLAALEPLMKYQVPLGTSGAKSSFASAPTRIQKVRSSGVKRFLTRFFN